ncbi:major facilitator superfamily domain-containing protein [Ditylenchus destructor]|nr:major facilitator superfamily domain-containing protein [Ditylenchus destructor]
MHNIDAMFMVSWNSVSKNLRRDVVEHEREATLSKDRRRESTTSSAPSKKAKLDALPPANVDADDPLDDVDDDLSESEDESDDDAELMAELERIKKERAAERAAKEKREQEEQEKIRHENVLSGNPLLNPDEPVDFKVKRRWDDDVIFKNCARGIDERKKEPTFINDAIRSEFHKKMMVRINTHKLLVFSLTFISYALYHASRKNLSGVKSSISADWLDNGTSVVPRKPLFPSMADAQTFLGTLDALFMICYAAALVYWGWIGDRYNPRNVVVFGMIASGVTMVLFGTLPHWAQFYSVPYYIAIYAIFGIVQACGWPNVVAIMANWFPRSNRGFIMGLWAACQPVGNILGAVVISSILPLGYQYTFAFNALLILAGAVVLSFCVNHRPPTGTIIEEGQIQRGIGRHSPEELLEVPESGSGRPISMCDALFLPSVLPYCLCNACLKFVNYAFFFWLPFYLTQKFLWDESEANRLSTFYDVGGIIGSVVGGYASDRLRHRSPILTAMLVTSLPLLFFYSDLGPNRWLHVIIMTFLGITISGPYNLIAMSTVTGLIDGTGSAGSAIGQLFLPLIQTHIGWNWVFYLFIVMNALSVVCLIKRFFHDCAVILKDRREQMRTESIEREPLIVAEDS